MAVIPRRIRGGGGGGLLEERFSLLLFSRPSVQQRTEKIYKREGDELRRLLRSFFFPFLFSNDHFPRELSFLHSCGTSIAVSNTSIGRTEISGGTYVFFTFPPWKGKGGVLSSSFFQFHRGSVR